jgi:hypothetical protein
VLQVLRKALPFILSPEKSGGVAGWSRDMFRESEDAGGGVGVCGRGIWDELGAWG